MGKKLKNIILEKEEADRKLDWPDLNHSDEYSKFMDLYSGLAGKEEGLSVFEGLLGNPVVFSGAEIAWGTMIMAELNALVQRQFPQTGPLEYLERAAWYNLGWMGLYDYAENKRRGGTSFLRFLTDFTRQKDVQAYAMCIAAKTAYDLATFNIGGFASKAWFLNGFGWALICNKKLAGTEENTGETVADIPEQYSCVEDYIPDNPTGDQILSGTKSYLAEALDGTPDEDSDLDGLIKKTSVIAATKDLSYALAKKYGCNPGEFKEAYDNKPNSEKLIPKWQV